MFAGRWAPSLIVVDLSGWRGLDIREQVLTQLLISVQTSSWRPTWRTK